MFRLTLAAALLALLIPATSLAKAKATRFYVSVGDSYSIGYQPGRGSTREGFADQTVTKARAKGLKLKLVNFGCGGATSKSIIQQKGCPKRSRPVGKTSPVYKTSQADAAVAFLKSHRKHVALITVSIGGNDVIPCVKATDPLTCVADGQAAIKENVITLAQRLHRAAPRAKLVGITYPDVILGELVLPEGKKDLANLSVVAFRDLINPTLKNSYESVGGQFIDVTSASGAYGSLEELTDFAPYGLIPKPVAEVCRLTWYCEKQDIHARKSGYALIADLIVATL